MACPVEPACYRHVGGRSPCTRSRSSADERYGRAWSVRLTINNDPQAIISQSIAYRRDRAERCTAIAMICETADDACSEREGARWLDSAPIFKHI